MRRRDSACHVQIKPELLFDVHQTFKSFYTPWVYVYLKLDHSYYLEKAPNSFYKIDTKPIINFFSVDKSTISRVFKDLINNGLIEKRGREFRLLNDIKNPKFAQNGDDINYPEFIQIYNNFFLDFVWALKNTLEDFKRDSRFAMKLIETFYYLITKNHHIMIAEDIVESKETKKSIKINLHHDDDYIGKFLYILKELKYLDYTNYDGGEEDGTFCTVYKYGTCTSLKKKYKKAKKDTEPNYRDQSVSSQKNGAFSLPTDRSIKQDYNRGNNIKDQMNEISFSDQKATDDYLEQEWLKRLENED